MEKELYELSDCKYASFFDDDYKGRVLVLSPEFLRSEHQNEQGQLWLATGGDGCEPGEPKKKLTAVRLSDGETAEFRRGQFYGAIHPKLLPDWAKLKLGGLPAGKHAAEQNNFTGRCYLQNGGCVKDIPLADWQDVLDYIRIQKDYQHRIEIAEINHDTVIAYVADNWCHIDPDVLLTESRNLTQDAPRQDGLKLRDVLLFETTGTAYIAHNSIDVGFVNVGRLFNMSQEEREDYNVLLNAKVKAIRPGAYGPQIVLTDIPAQAIIDYDRAMSGHDHLITQSESEQETGPEMSI